MSWSFRLFVLRSWVMKVVKHNKEHLLTRVLVESIYCSFEFGLGFKKSVLADIWDWTIRALIESKLRLCVSDCYCVFISSNKSLLVTCLNLNSKNAEMSLFAPSPCANHKIIILGIWVSSSTIAKGHWPWYLEDRMLTLLPRWDFSRAYISYLFLTSVFVPRTNLELSYSVSP